jgi:hypothetical protein
VAVLSGVPPFDEQGLYLEPPQSLLHHHQRSPGNPPQKELTEQASIDEGCVVGLGASERKFRVPPAISAPGTHKWERPIGKTGRPPLRTQADQPWLATRALMPFHGEAPHFGPQE